jgi:hypothetical protein
MEAGDSKSQYATSLLREAWEELGVATWKLYAPLMYDGALHEDGASWMLYHVKRLEGLLKELRAFLEEDLGVSG